MGLLLLPHKLEPTGGVEISELLNVALCVGKGNVVDDDLAVGVHHPRDEHVLEPPVNVRHGFSEPAQHFAVALRRRDFQRNQLVDEPRVGRSLGAL